MTAAHNEAVSRLESERTKAITAHEKLLKKMPEQSDQDRFIVEKFVNDTQDPKAYAHEDGVVTFTYEPFDFRVPKVIIFVLS